MFLYCYKINSIYISPINKILNNSKTYILPKYIFDLSN
jgi:hypothetical protein